jgi:hypothetical protein
MAVIELLGPMELGIAVFGEVVPEGMEEDPHVGGVADHLMPVLRDRDEMLKTMAHKSFTPLKSPKERFRYPQGSRIRNRDRNGSLLC